MELLKDDGSLDIGRIRQLPVNERMNILGELTDRQFDEYMSKVAINEDKAQIFREVDCTMEEDMEGAGFIKADDVIDDLKKKYGI